jgi:phosphoribosylformimino-5-aminoimidazole carboxamide ribotide isomerase
VIDLSCRKVDKGYRVATDRWRTITEAALGRDLFDTLAPYCAEFLIHAADVEGLMRGVDEDLVALLGGWVTRPATYAGGAKALEDIARVDELSGGKLDLTIGSALDIFGGATVRYADAARFGRRS